MTQGRFITLEGVEGAGKSTALAEVERLLRETGRELVVTREPGGTRLGEALRGLLLAPEHAPVDQVAELLMMFAARAQHLAQRIAPALASGRWVLCDRFTDATFAYQGGGRGLSMARIAQLQDIVQGGLRPDLTLLLDLPVNVGRARASARSAPDRIESEQDQFFERVRQAYLDIASREPERVKIIDASRSLDDVLAQVQAVIQGYGNG